MRSIDVRASLFQFVRNRALELGYITPQIYPSALGIPTDRPLWIVQQVTQGGRHQKTAVGITEYEQRYNVMILTSGVTKGFYDAERFVTHFQQKMVNNRWRIAGLLVDFHYPKPRTLYVPSGGSLAVGTYYVAVSGIGRLDPSDESLISDPVEVEVTAANGAIEIVIPKYPATLNWFPTYNVYVGTDPDDLHKTVDSPLAAHDFLTTVYTVDSLNPGGDPPISNGQSVIKYRLIKVDEDQFSISVDRDRSGPPGTWLGLCTMVLSAQIVEVIDEQAYPMLNINNQYVLEDA